MDALLLHVLGVDSLRVGRRLLEPEQESVPELDVGKGGKTHEKEHSIKNRKRKQLQNIQGQDTETDQ